MLDAVRQVWWVPVALIVALGQFVLAAFAITGDQDTESRVASFLILVVRGSVMLLGLYLRAKRRAVGNVVVLVACAFAAIWFWTILLPVGAIIVAIGVIFSGWRDPAV